MKTLSMMGVALIAAGMLATTSCNSLKKTSTQTPEKMEQTAEPAAGTATPAKSQAIDALIGEWSITEVAGKNIVVNGEDHPKITFAQVAGHDDMLRVIGFNGCNYINGDWQFSGDAVRPAGEFISSLRACPDAPYENDINVAINTVTSYRLVNAENLELLAAGKVVMKLRSRNLSFLNGAWKVTAIQGNPVPATADVKVVIDVDECKIHGNAGCNILNGDVVVNLDKGDGIEFKNLATTRMMCPDMDTERAFLLALEQVDTAVRGATASEAVMRDDSGKAVINLTRLSPDQIAEGE